MTEREKILFNKLKKNKNGYIRLNFVHFVQIDFLVNLIEKQEKVIDEMAKYIERTCYFTDDCENNCDITYDKDCNECIKECFYRKVENNE